MSSSAAGGPPADFTALPPRDCIRKRTRRPADQVPVVAASAAAAASASAAAAAAAAADDAAERRRLDEHEGGGAARGEQEAAGAGGAAAAATVAAAAAANGGEAGAGEEAAAKEGAPAAARAPPDLPAYRSCAERGRKFEYLDHTADVQIHAWGATLEEALENAGLAMFNYMTPLAGVRAPEEGEGGEEGEGEGDGGQEDEGREEGGGGFRGRAFAAEGHDADSLVFNFLDELLFAFASDLAVCSELKVVKLTRGEEEGGGGAGGGEAGGAAAAAKKKWRVEAVGSGERFDRDRHEAGTEIKAITYSAMQVVEKEGDAEIFVIVDI